MNQVINFGASPGSEAETQHSEGTCHITQSSVTVTAQPADLTDRVDAAVLVNCVGEQVARFCEKPETDPAFHANEPNRRELLGVLTFAYARRIYDSEEIARRCQEEASFRQLCHGHAPFTGELIRFRRRYRPLLITVLANVFMHASQTLEATPALSAALKRQLLCQATSRLDTARHLDSGSD